MTKTEKNRRYLQAGLLFLLVLCTVASYRHTSDNNTENLHESQEKASISSEKQEAEAQTSLPADEESIEDELPPKNVWANFQESRIGYGNGCYFYASQSDHYYLYRADEDGRNPKCLAKVHAGDIHVQDDTVYFRNLGDGRGIYQINADGTGMKRLCLRGRDLQFSNDYIFFLTGDQLYRMEKDGLQKELVAQDVSQYQLEGGTLYYSTSYYNRETDDYRMQVRKTDLTTQTVEELCLFHPSGKMVVIGEDIYCIDKEKITRFSLQNKTMKSFTIPTYTDSCVCQGYFYGLYENIDENTHKRKVTVYRIDLRNQKRETLYEHDFYCECNGNYAPQNRPLSDLYATEKDVFFRQFVSEQEGCQWFRLSAEGITAAWEDRDAVPKMLPARNLEDSPENYASLSVTSLMRSTEGYEAYLAADLTYEESYHVAGYDSSLDAPFSWDIPFEITLPQFNSKIAGYEQINAYFQNAYQEALSDKDTYFKTVSETYPERTSMWFQSTSYRYIYIGEQYITVDQRWNGYWGGAHVWFASEPATFDRTTGESLSLEALLGMPTDEAVSRLTASVYKYMEGVGGGEFLLQDQDLLTEKYHTEKFFLFPDGIGIYYKTHALGSTADGDFLFIVPYEEFPEAFQF